MFVKPRQGYITVGQSQQPAKAMSSAQLQSEIAAYKQKSRERAKEQAIVKQAASGLKVEEAYQKEHKWDKVKNFLEKTKKNLAPVKQHLAKVKARQSKTLGTGSLQTPEMRSPFSQDFSRSPFAQYNSAMNRPAVKRAAPKKRHSSRPREKSIRITIGR